MKMMKKLTPNDPETRSPDLVAENLSTLKALFPEIVTEGPDGVTVNVDVLKALVGDKTVTDADEKYGLNWHGKRRARQLALTPSTGTLRPCPEDSVDWDTTHNLMIEGDNLEVLKLLQKSYAGKVKLIYIDPPYNTGKDFVYPDNFQDNIRNYLELTGQAEGGQKISSNTEAGGRFHTNWLDMMYPRLRLARSLLREDGVLAISIDDNEVERLRAMCAEIFGEENFAAQVCIQSNPRGRQSDTFFATVHEYLLVWARTGESCVIDGAALTDEQKAAFGLTDQSGKPYRLLGLRQRGAASFRQDRPDMFFPIYVNPKTLKVSLDPAPGFTAEVLPRKSTGEDGRWMWGKEKCRNDIHLLVPQMIERRQEFDIFVVDYLERDGEERTRKFKTIWDDKKLNTQNGTQEVKELLGCAAMSFPKPVALLLDVIQLGASNGDIILDFFVGSGTTGHAVMAQNAADGGKRRYILVQLPESLDPKNKDQKVAAEFCQMLKKPLNIAELTKERLRRAAKKIKDENPIFAGDLGFRVFKLDSTNIREWDPKRDDLEGSLQLSIEHLKTNRTETDILYELLLKLGLDLCVRMEKLEVRSEKLEGKKHTVHSIGGGVLMACLSEKIELKDVETLGLGIVEWHKTLAPAGDATCVFRDSAFADDVAKTNLAAILNQHGIANVRSL
jgi:adenine-specific DNA-methyltransferase